MQRRGPLAIRDLLNTGPTSATTPVQAAVSQSSRPTVSGLFNVRPQLLRLANLLDGATSALDAPSWVQQHLDSALAYLDRSELANSTSATSHPDIPDTSDVSLPFKQSTNVAINRITTLEVLYKYPVGYVLEYPETSSTGSIGHLFHMDPNDWRDPVLNIAYSRGAGTGQSLSGTSVKCDLLVDSEGNRVECRERHTTCGYFFLRE